MAQRISVFELEGRRERWRQHEARGERPAVFDKARTYVPPGRRGSFDISFSRSDKDRAPPRSVVTARLMGDPPPGRSALDAPDVSEVAATTIRKFETDLSDPSALAPRRYQGGLQ